MFKRLLPLMLFLSSFCFATDEKPLIIVSVAPYKFIVNELSQGLTDVFLIVPAGTSAHTFEPSPKDMMKAAQAKLWFTLGETFEKKAIGAIQAVNKEFKTIDLTKGVDLIESDPMGGCQHCHHGHDHGSADLHIWLSPKELKIQGETIAQGIIQLFPASNEQILERLKELNDRLDQLNEQIKTIVADKQSGLILVSHPAFGYFCRDYGFRQLSIEVEGKDPTPKRLLELMTLAKEGKVQKIFAEPQYSDKGAQLVANEIGAKIVVIDPYKENLFENLIHIAKEFAQ